MGYSSQVSASLQVGAQQFDVNKTGPNFLCLTYPSPEFMPKGTVAILTVTIDDNVDSEEVKLIEGVNVYQQRVQYER